MTPAHDTTTDKSRVTAAPAPSIVMQWVDCPMRSVIAASVATMSTLGIVLSGIWAINAALT